MRAFSRIGIVLSLIAVCGIAYAAVTVKREEQQMHFKNGIYVGTASAAAANKVSKSLGSGAQTVDIANTVAATCSDSSGITITGAAVGDPCSLGTPANGGDATGTFTCYISATNTAKVRYCNPTAGAVNPASGTFYLRVTSSQ